MYFQQCRILFFEIQKPSTLKLYRRLANCGGCTIVESIDQNPTHMIVPPSQYSPNQYARIWQAHDAGIDVVKPEWLIESVKQQQFLDVEQFLFELPSTTSKAQNLSSRSGAFMSVVVEQEKAPSTPSMASSLMDSRNDITRVTTVEEENQFNKSGRRTSKMDEMEDNGLDIHEEVIQNGVDMNPVVINRESGSIKVVEINEDDPTTEEQPPNVLELHQEKTTAVRTSESSFRGNVEMNLSMPLDAYIYGNRPVRFKFRESELAELYEDNPEEMEQSENTTILLSKGLSNAARNTCPSESFYERAMGPNLNTYQTNAPTQESIINEVEKEAEVATEKEVETTEKRSLIPADLRERLSRAARTSTSITENKENASVAPVESLKTESETPQVESQVVGQGQITWDYMVSTQELQKLPAKKPSITNTLDSDEPYFGTDSDDTFTKVDSENEKNKKNEGTLPVENEEKPLQEQPKSSERTSRPSRTSKKEQAPVQKPEATKKTSAFTAIPAEEKKGPPPDMDSFNATWPDDMHLQPKTRSQLKKPQIIGLEDSVDEEIEAEDTGNYVAGLVNIRSQSSKQQGNNTAELIEEVHEMSIRSNPTVNANQSENQETHDTSAKENQEQPSLRRSQRQKRKKKLVSTDSEESTQTPAKKSSRQSNKKNSVTEEQKKMDETIKTISIPGTPVPVTKHIMLTGFEVKEANNLSEMIAELNGTLLDDTINLGITDIIVAKRICKSEKLVSGIASGKKIVSMNYVVKSMQCGKWQDVSFAWLKR